MFRYSLIKNLNNLSKKENKEKTAANNSTEEKAEEKQNDRPTTISDEVFLLRRGYFLMSGGLLGEGTYSKVKRAYSKIRACDVAIKIVNRKIAPKDFLKRFLPRELQIIGHLSHPNVCAFYEVLDIGEKVFIVMQHAPKGDLLEYIQSNKFLTETAAKSMFLQIVSAVSYLHSHNVLHRDLKCENILLAKDLKPLLTDFGFAKHLPNIQNLNKTYCGSSAYAPIEILKGVPYDGRPTEVWSLGCILYIITTGAMPFDDSNKAEQIKQMKKGPNFTRTKQHISQPLKLLILRMLEINPSERITLEEVPNHEWFENTGNGEGESAQN